MVAKCTNCLFRKDLVRLPSIIPRRIADVAERAVDAEVRARIAVEKIVEVRVEMAAIMEEMQRASLVAVETIVEARAARKKVMGRRLPKKHKTKNE